MALELFQNIYNDILQYFAYDQYVVYAIAIIGILILAMIGYEMLLAITIVGLPFFVLAAGGLNDYGTTAISILFVGYYMAIALARLFLR